MAKTRLNGTGRPHRMLIAGAMAFGFVALCATPALAQGENEGDRLRSRMRQNTNQETRRQTADPLTIDGGLPADGTGVAEAGGSAKIWFENPNHDFGVVKDKEELKVVFKFRNAGGSPLIIEKINTGCGCTVAALDKNEYAPGESGEINITYNPKGHGKSSRNIQVMTNDPEQRSFSLTIGAEVVPVVVASPTALQFGQVSIGNERAMTLQVFSRDPGMKITSVESNGPEFDVKVVENPVREGFIDPNLPGFGAVQVTLKGDASVGRLLRVITVRTSAKESPESETQNQETQVNVFASIKGELTVQPPFLRFPPLKTNEDFERELLVTRAGGKPFKVTEVKVVNSNLPVEAIAEPVEHGSGYRIVVKGRAGATASNFRGTLQILTDLDKEPVTEIQFSGLIRAGQ